MVYYREDPKAIFKESGSDYREVIKNAVATCAFYYTIEGRQFPKSILTVGDKSSILYGSCKLGNSSVDLTDDKDNQKIEFDCKARITQYMHNHRSLQDIIDKTILEVDEDQFALMPCTEKRLNELIELDNVELSFWKYPTLNYAGKEILIFEIVDAIQKNIQQKYEQDEYLPLK